MFNITVENQVFFLVEYKNILFVRSLKVFPWKSFTFGLIYNLNMFFYSVFSPHSLRFPSIRITGYSYVFIVKYYPQAISKKKKHWQTVYIY